MTYVVAEPCVNCRYTDCALVCPVEAFHLDDDMLVINPETCIDCDACVPECPVEAVFSESALPAEWSNYTAINAERALSAGAIGAATAYWKRKSMHAERKAGDVWARPGMMVTFRAEVMPGRERDE